jgi:hypothetical protein
MKKTLAILFLSAVLALTFAACGGNGGASSADKLKDALNATAEEFAVGKPDDNYNVRLTANATLTGEAEGESHTYLTSQVTEVLGNVKHTVGESFGENFDTFQQVTDGKMYEYYSHDGVWIRNEIEDKTSYSAYDLFDVAYDTLFTALAEKVDSFDYKDGVYTAKADKVADLDAGSLLGDGDMSITAVTVKIADGKVSEITFGGTMQFGDDAGVMTISPASLKFEYRVVTAITLPDFVE